MHQLISSICFWRHI